MREVDDAQQAEDHRQAEAQHRVERAVDQAEQQLAQEGLHRDAEDLHGLRAAAGASLGVYFQSAHFDSALVVQASSPLKVSATL